MAAAIGIAVGVGDYDLALVAAQAVRRGR